MKKFINEFFNRFGLKGPSFFQVIQLLSIITGTIAGVPALLSQFQTELGITLPDWVLTISSKTVAISAAVAWVIAKLPVKTATNLGEIMKQDKKLPFTNQDGK